PTIVGSIPPRMQRQGMNHFERSLNASSHHESLYVHLDELLHLYQKKNCLANVDLQFILCQILQTNSVSIRRISIVVEHCQKEGCYL
ncbi:hypothetical protein PFISCL1PPCAC_9303, partial [Pristionchus fissidentatus]